MVPYYIRWHYGKALSDLVIIAGNFIWFAWHFFSIELMLRTLFSPWQRLSEEKKSGFDVESFFSAIAINTVMRFVGLIVRLVFIVIGLACIIIISALSVIAFAVWIALPGVIAVAFIIGIRLLFP